MTKCSHSGCPRPPVPGFKMCQQCRDYYAAYRFAWRERRILSGVCTKCPAKSLDDSEFCGSCRDKLNADKRRRHAELKARAA